MIPMEKFKSDHVGSTYEIRVGERKWSEDEATINDPDHWSIRHAWWRAFHEDLDTDKGIKIRDAGDAIFYLMPNGYIVCMSYRGNCSIHEVGYPPIFGAW